MISCFPVSPLPSSLPTFLPSVSKGLLSALQVSDSEQGAWGQSQSPAHPTELAFQWRGVGETQDTRTETHTVSRRESRVRGKGPLQGGDWSRAPARPGKGVMEAQVGWGSPQEAGTPSFHPLQSPFLPLGPLSLLQPLTCPFSSVPGSFYKAQTSSRPSSRKAAFPAPEAPACVSGPLPAPWTTVWWPRSGPLC